MIGLVQQRARGDSAPFRSSRAPIPWKSWTTSARCLPQFRREHSAVDQLAIAFDASESIRGSIHDVEFTLVLTICAGRDGDLPVPAQSLRPRDSRHRGSASRSSARSR